MSDVAERGRTPAPVAGVDARRVRTHVFVVPQNNSGSTFLTACLHVCRRVIRLPCEGQHVTGFRGPVPRQFGDQLIWGRDGCRTGAVLAADGLYDWPAIRRCWYAAAVPASAHADVLVEKSPPNVARVASLDRHFPGARFLFLVRDPFALAESIIRHRSAQQQGSVAGRGADLPGVVVGAAQHVVTTLRLQRASVERYEGTGRGLLVRYEDMCDQPVATELAVARWAPELSDLCVRRQLRIKGRYDQLLTNLNGKHHARLPPEQIEQIEQLEAAFAPHAGLFATFRYDTVLERAPR
jgi:hypothetical protein